MTRARIVAAALLVALLLDAGLLCPVPHGFAARPERSGAIPVMQVLCLCGCHAHGAAAGVGLQLEAALDRSDLPVPERFAQPLREPWLQALEPEPDRDDPVPRTLS